MRRPLSRCVLSACIAMLPALALAADMPASRDHPSIPRVAGAEIFGYAFNDYDAGGLLITDDDNKLAVVRPEGARTRILYRAQSGDSPLKVQKNYETALAELGDTTQRYQCRSESCSAHQLAINLWSKDAMIPTSELTHPMYLLGFAHNFSSPTYTYTEVVSDDAKYHVGVFAGVVRSNNPNVEFRDRTAILLEVLEIEDFEPTLEFVDASEMQSQITETGRVALYGIHFDHDQATMRPESEATLAEISKVMSDDPGLKIYVVGHTDDVGDLAYNEDLSLRRAATVVDALTAAGIDGDRLTPVGVGPAAPITSNDSEDGRAQNRRVELVKRSEGR